MTKEEFVKKYKEKHGLTTEQADQQFTNVINMIAEELRAGNDVPIRPIGVLTVKDTKERPGRNPRTGDPITIPAGKKYSLSVSETFRKKA